MGRRVVRRRARDPDREAVPLVSRRLIIAFRESRLGVREKEEMGLPMSEVVWQRKRGEDRSNSTACDPGNLVCWQPPAKFADKHPRTA